MWYTHVRFNFRKSVRELTILRISMQKFVLYNIYICSFGYVYVIPMPLSWAVDQNVLHMWIFGFLLILKEAGRGSRRIEMMFSPFKKKSYKTWIRTLFCWIRFSHLPAAIFILLDAAHPSVSDSFDYIHYFFGVCVVLRCMCFRFILILQYGFAEIMHIPFHMHNICQSQVCFCLSSVYRFRFYHLFTAVGR